MVKPRVSSTDASTRTIRARSKNISEHICQVSSSDTNEEAALVQLSALLRGKSKEELKCLLHSENLLQIKIPAGKELCLKAQMGWTWHEMRKLKRYNEPQNMSCLPFLQHCISVKLKLCLIKVFYYI